MKWFDSFNLMHLGYDPDGPHINFYDPTWVVTESFWSQFEYHPADCPDIKEGVIMVQKIEHDNCLGLECQEDSHEVIVLMQTDLGTGMDVQAIPCDFYHRSIEESENLSDDSDMSTVDLDPPDDRPSIDATQYETPSETSSTSSTPLDLPVLQDGLDVSEISKFMASSMTQSGS